MRADGGGLYEEAVVAEVAREHDRVVVDRRTDAAEDALLPVDREQPVAVDAEHERAGRDLRQRVFDAAPTPTHVVRVHRLDEGQVAVRIEPAGELVAVEVEVALHGEPAAAAERAHARLPRPLKAQIELGRAAVVQQRHAPRQREAAVRTLAVGRVVVVAAREARVDAEGLELHRVERDLVGGRRRGSRQHREALDAIRQPDAPLQSVHAAHRAADDGRPPLDAETVGQQGLRRHLVAHREIRKARPPFAPVGADRGGAGRTLASAQHVRGDDEPAVGVDRGSRSDHLAPPAVGRMPRARLTTHVTVAREGVQHEHRVVGGRVQLAPRLVREPREGEPLTVLGAERPERSEASPARGVAVAPRATRRRARAQQARVGLGDRRRRHRVFRGLPVHGIHSRGCARAAPVCYASRTPHERTNSAPDRVVGCGVRGYLRGS